MEKPQDMTELSTNYVTYKVSLIKIGLMFHINIIYWTNCKFSWDTKSYQNEL